MRLLAMIGLVALAYAASIAAIHVPHLRESLWIIGMQVLIWLQIGLMCYRTVITGIRHIRYLGMPSAQACEKMMGLWCLKAKGYGRVMRVTHPYQMASMGIRNCCMLYIAQYLLKIPIPLCVYALPIAFLFYYAVGLAQPPAVLYFGTAGRISVDTFTSLVTEVELRVLSLLAPRARYPAEAGIIDEHTLRTQDDDLWRIVAAELMGLAKLIVVDARVTNQGLEHEAGTLFERGLCDSTIFVISESKPSPLFVELRRGGIDVGSFALDCVTESDIVDRVRSRLGLDGKRR
jgi:hypothetical protein